MARLPRLLVPDRPTVYHVMSRTALPGLPFDGIDKDDFLARLKSLSQIYFTEILGFCLMDNHFHLLVRMFPEDHEPDADLSERYRRKDGGDMGVGRRERLRCYREFVYETGAVDTKKGGSLDEDVVRRERSRNYVLGDVDLFRYRCRNFVDSGVLGSKKFVEEVTEKIRQKVPDRKKRTPHRFKGLGTIYTMKRLAPEL